MQAVGTSVVTIVISLPVLIARLAARYKLTSRLWMDDYMAIAATVRRPKNWSHWGVANF